MERVATDAQHDKFCHVKKLAFFFEVPVKDFEEAIQEALDISIIQKVDKGCG